MKVCKCRNYFIFVLLFATMLAFSGNNIKANAAGKCTVVLNPNNGSAASRSLATKGGTYGSILYTPSKNGYYFSGWYTSWSGGTRVYNNSRVPSSDTQYLYARWTPKSMTVTMELGYGSARWQKTVTYGSSYGSLGTPGRTGYVFQGWFTSPSGGWQVKDGSTVYSTVNHTLFAQWSRQVCTINLQPRNGKQATQVNVYYGDKYKGLYTPTKKGYIFQGWYTKASSDGKKRTTKNTVTSSHALYAHWKAQTVQVTFDWNNELRPTTERRSVSYEGKYKGNFDSLPSSPIAGYKFLGWYTKKTGGDRVWANTTMNRLKDHTIYAHWEALPYEVTLDPNGGTINGKSSINKAVTFNKTYGVLGTAAKTGYDFVGWYTAKTGGTKIEAGTLVRTAKNHTLYAQYTAKNVTVNFNLNYPQGVSAGVTMAPKTVKYNGPYGTLNNPASIKGYIFKGWYSASNGGNKVEANTVVKNPNAHILYAHWEAVKVYVNLKGEKISTRIQVTFGQPYGDKLPTQPSNPGHHFMGWYDSQGRKIDKNSIVDRAVEHDLTAKWREVSLNVEGFENVPVLCFGINGGVDEIGSSYTQTTNGVAVYKFKVSSDGAWKASSTLETVRFRVGDSGNWEKSISSSGDKVLYIKCIRHDLLESGEAKGTVSITTNAKTIRKAVTQVTPRTLKILRENTKVKKRAQERYSFIPDSVFEADGTTNGWVKHNSNTYYLVATLSSIDEVAATHRLTSYVYVVQLFSGNYFLTQITPQGKVGDTINEVTYEMRDYEHIMAEFAKDKLIGIATGGASEFLGVDEFFEAYPKIKNILDLTGSRDTFKEAYDLGNEIYLITSGGKDGDEDMLYNATTDTINTIGNLCSVSDSELGSWFGDTQTVINFIKTVRESKNSRAKSFQNFENSIHKSLPAFNVWEDLYSKTDIRPDWLKDMQKK